MRIITGSARGARLKSPKGMDTRPTADRIKESLFNILGREVAGRQVLDLFAGTGSLGLEALSRGAAAAVFVDKGTAALIEENAAHTHLAETATVFRGDVPAVLRRLSATGKRFDLVFCDPPYRLGLWERTLLLLDELPLLAESAVVVVEHGIEENALPELRTLRAVRNEKYGRTTQLTFFKKVTGEVDG